MFSLSRIKNAAGELQGFGSCGICGDSWAWKEEKSIPMDPGGTNGVFPVCRECFASESAQEIIAALYRLQAEWALNSDSLAELQRESNQITRLTNWR